MQNDSGYISKFIASFRQSSCCDQAGFSSVQALFPANSRLANVLDHMLRAVDYPTIEHCGSELQSLGKEVLPDIEQANRIGKVFATSCRC
jgi:hypothetical protein